MTTETEGYYDAGADWDSIPSYMHGAVVRYVMHGIGPGSFLTAVLCNDLKEAFARADGTNQHCMLQWVRFLYNCMPSNCHGSPEIVRAWLDRGGLSNRGIAQ